MFDRELFEWKYQPKVFDDLILNKSIKPSMKKALEQRPNMFLYGPPGVGKGSFVNVLKNYHDLFDYTITINCSKEGGIDTIRGRISDFVSTSSSKMKLVFLNEIDDPRYGSMQKSLRQMIEDTQKHTQWILACNYHQSVIPELKSRCESFHLSNPPADEIYKKCVFILKKEIIKYNNASLLYLVKKCYPDIRNTLITLKQNIINDKLQNNIVLSDNDKIFDKIFLAMKSKDPEEVRKLIRSYMIHYKSLYNYLYEKIMNEDEVFEKDAEAILLIGEHLYRDEMSSIKEINFMHMYFKMLKNGVI